MEATNVAGAAKAFLIKEIFAQSAEVTIEDRQNDAKKIIKHLKDIVGYGRRGLEMWF